MWVRNLLQKHDRKKVQISLSIHFVTRKLDRNLELDKVEETVRTGKIFKQKCRWPKKLCFARYYGKINRTYFVIVAFNKNKLEVVTAWENKGN